MKKLTVTLLLLTLVFSLLAFNSCAKEERMLSLGIGTYTELINESAKGTVNGYGNAITTVAVALFDENGKLVDCYFDVADSSVEYTSEGKYVAPTEAFKTKRELGDSYVMSSDETKLKWYEQADAFANAAKGKTTDEIKALVADGGKGVSEVISAGCTITVSDFALAVEDAAKNTKSITVGDAAKLELSVKTEATGNDASGSELGSVKLTVKMDAKVKEGSAERASLTKTLENSFAFNAEGQAQS